MIPGSLSAWSCYFLVDAIPGSTLLYRSLIFSPYNEKLAQSLGQCNPRDELQIRNPEKIWAVSQVMLWV